MIGIGIPRQEINRLQGNKCRVLADGAILLRKAHERSKRRLKQLLWL